MFEHTPVRHELTSKGLSVANLLQRRVTYDKKCAVVDRRRREILYELDPGDCVQV